MKSPATGNHTFTANFSLRSLEFLPHLLDPNFIETIPEEQLVSCGAKDCLMGPVATNSTYHPSQQLIYTLLGVYTGMYKCPASYCGKGLFPSHYPTFSIETPATLTWNERRHDHKASFPGQWFLAALWVCQPP